LYTAYLIAAIVMTLSVLEGHSLLQAFTSAIFLICGVSRGHSADSSLCICRAFCIFLLAKQHAAFK